MKTKNMHAPTSSVHLSQAVVTRSMKIKNGTPISNSL